MTERVIPILAYHSFSKLEKPWPYALEPALFEEHLAYLREKNFFSLTLAESLQDQPLALSSKRVVFTFNGAFQDFERVLPLLNRYGFTATLFVPTAFVGQKSSWLPAAQHRPVLDWEALRGLANTEIASLGHAYLNFAEISEADAKADIVLSKELLEDKLGSPCQSFAYPDGHYRSTTLSLVKEAGFLAACTLQPEVSTLTHDLFALPRFAMTSQTNLAAIVGVQRSKSRFSLLDLFRPQRRSRLQTPEARYIPPPLPTKVTTEQVRQERTQQVTLMKPSLLSESEQSVPEVRARPPLHREVREEPTPFQTGTTEPTSSPLPPRSREEALQQQDSDHVTDLEQQGDFLADLKTVLVQQQGKHLIEYNMFVAATEKLQASQEAGVFAPERVRAVYQTRAKLEAALANEREKHTQHQRLKLQGYLDKFTAMPVPEALASSAENVKQILSEYLEHLNVEALPEDVLQSTEQLALNLEQRLNASYRSGLQRLVQEATTIKAMDFLVTLQRASNALEHGHYPDLRALENALETIRQADGSRRLIQERSQTFGNNLAAAARVFEIVSTLNNEDVNTVRQLLYYLLSQRDVFPKLSPTMQQELENSLQEAKNILERLEKDYQATKAVAAQLVSDSDHVFDSLFGNEPSQKK
jgi:peptidoglycan/xylan/chitin deacetylase (PgdA/CDA1 family)